MVPRFLRRRLNSVCVSEQPGGELLAGPDPDPMVRWPRKRASAAPKVSVVPLSVLGPPA